MILDEQDMFLERLSVFPTVQGFRVDKQADLPVLADEVVDLRRNRGEIVSLQLCGRCNFEGVGRKGFDLDH